jgi:hypothetical protein
MADKLPGKGLLGWLGRQVGYVRHAVKTTPSANVPAKRPPPKSSAAQSADDPKSRAESANPADGGVLYRHDHVQEAEHPSQPGVKLRRTIIDEVIVEQDSQPPDVQP